jgi:ABC-type glutathione transport system ATPase component
MVYPRRATPRALFLQLGQDIAQPPASHVTPADEVNVRWIDELEHVIGTTQNSDHARHMADEGSDPIIGAGQFMTVMGPSGGGKTTLVKITLELGGLKLDRAA